MIQGIYWTVTTFQALGKRIISADVPTNTTGKVHLLSSRGWLLDVWVRLRRLHVVSKSFVSPHSPLSMKPWADLTNQHWPKWPCGSWTWPSIILPTCLSQSNNSQQYHPSPDLLLTFFYFRMLHLPMSLSPHAGHISESTLIVWASPSPKWQLTGQFTEDMLPGLF